MDPSLRFGEFELFPERFELCRAGHPLRLERKPMEMLILLTLQSGRVVTRTELAEHLWGSDVFVDTEHGINTAVRKLRQALRDDPETPRFIQTVPKLGYRFLAPVSAHPEPAAAPHLVPVQDSPANSGTTSPQLRSFKALAVFGLGACCLAVALVVSVHYRSRASLPVVEYQQLTDLTDAAAAPALSPDGHTMAFIRGDSSFGSAGAIFVKALPNGEPRLVSNDQRPKYGLAFSPDGSQIAYTVFGDKAFATYTVSIFGGDTGLLLNNAAGLSWLGADQLLFSETRSGIHLGVVTGSVARGAIRDLYFPAHQRGMAHYSQASPDHHWILVVEMDSVGWTPCRLVPFEEHTGARVVGPKGACTAAGWSPDGQWMYFVAVVSGRSHLWRQRFPAGVPQQVTFGAAEEDGLAVDPIGHAVITSLGTTQSALWIHDEKGERALSSQGEVLNASSPPLFRENDKFLYYLLNRRAGPPGAELWRADPRSGKSEAVIPGVSILDYDISPDGSEVVFSAPGSAGSELWLAPTDRSRLPSRLGAQGASFPHFGPNGRILFQVSEGEANYLEQVDRNGLSRSKLVSFPIEEFQSVSPRGHWAITLVSESPGSIHPTLVAIPFDGAPPRRICAGYCTPRWSSDGKFLFLSVIGSSPGAPGKTLVFHAGPKELPDLPPGGIEALSSLENRTNATQIPRDDLVAGNDPKHYAFVKTTVQRNLFRLTLK